ncbi:MAG: FAD-dependent monooxygenase, partial [Actinomycetota bacterium]|nr:FAD-dependent monooxygenase [Actinomycetota bacterium]
MSTTFKEQRMGEVIAEPDTDVVVVGYGPAGMAVAELLGAAGHRVIVLERYEGLYNLPRAATFDDETMRTLAKMGLAESLLPKLRRQPSYEWRNGQGELLTEQGYAEVGRSGWAEWYMMYQPDLEDALDRACRASANVEVHLGAPVEGIEQSAETVTLTVGGAGLDGSSTVTAQYVVACDGGNSLVRRTLGVGEDDYGFAEPWMVCDFRFRRPTDVPMALQLCDPKQPTSIISLGPDHHRVSFMLDSVADFETQRDPEL